MDGPSWRQRCVRGRSSCSRASCVYDVDKYILDEMCDGSESSRDDRAEDVGSVVRLAIPSFSLDCD